MINDKHNSNTELIAQGLGNIASGLFGGIPATGAIARTAANIKNGGRTPIAGMIHAVVLLLVLLVLMPLAGYIPMPTIAAILFVVAYNMSEWREFVSIIKKSPKSDTLILLVTFVLTVVFDLVVAIIVGVILATVMFMKRMSDVTDAHGWKEFDENTDAPILALKDGKHFSSKNLSELFLAACAEKDIAVRKVVFDQGISAAERTYAPHVSEILSLALPCSRLYQAEEKTIATENMLFALKIKFKKTYIDSWIIPIVLKIIFGELIYRNKFLFGIFQIFTANKITSAARKLFLFINANMLNFTAFGHNSK
jgi:hypothetical protein